VASRAATLRSHQSASSSPPATAGPSIAAITGFDNLRRVGPHRRVAALDTVIAAAGGYLLQVGAGAEDAAAAGQDGNRARRVAVEAAKGGSQRLIRG
jgi:hypothetical protein